MSPNQSYAIKLALSKGSEPQGERLVPFISLLFPVPFKRLHHFVASIYRVIWQRPIFGRIPTVDCTFKNLHYKRL